MQIVYVSRKLIFAQGTNDISRGNRHDGIMQGIKMKDFILLHLSAMQKSTHIRDLIDDILGNLKYEVLDSKGKFNGVKGNGNFV